MQATPDAPVSMPLRPRKHGASASIAATENDHKTHEDHDVPGAAVVQLVKSLVSHMHENSELDRTRTPPTDAIPYLPDLIA